MKAHRGRLRLFLYPKYKNQRSRYEIRMRYLREKIGLLALKLADTLKAVPHDDPALIELFDGIHHEEYADQLLWIDTAIDEIFESAQALEPDSVIQAQSQKLVEIRNSFYDAIEQHRQHGSTVMISTFAPPSLQERLQKAHLAKCAMVKLLEALALPFCPIAKLKKAPSQ